MTAPGTQRKIRALRGARSAAEGVAFACLALAVAWLLWPRLGLGAAEDPKIDAGHARFDAMAAAYNADPIDFEGTEGTRVLAAAVIYAEDRGFSDRPGWVPPASPKGLARALLANLQGRRIGGSTIPQQLAKLMIREETGGVYDKWRELVFATELTRRHDPETLLGVYINLALSLRDRDPVGGARTAALALRGRPLTTISREDAVLLAVLPRGWSKMKRKPAVATARVRGVRDGLAASGLWDVSRVSWLDDDALDTTEELGLWPGWHALVDGGPDALDEAAALTAAQDAVDVEVSQLQEAGVPSVGGVLVAFLGTPPSASAATAPPEAMVVATAPWLDVPLLNLASGSKVELLDLVVDELGEASAYTLMAAHSRPIRWWWREGGGPRDGRRPGLLRPRDAIKPHKLAPYGPTLSLADTVLLSVNSSAMSHLVNRVPYALYLADPAGYVARATELVPEAPLLATDTERRVASNRLAELGADIAPENIPDTLTGQAAPLYVLRLLAERRARKGVTVRRKLPEDPTSLLGNSSAESGADIARYLGTVFMAPTGCRLTPTGRVLATGFDRGTLSGVSRALGNGFGRAAGKTGSSPRDDTIWMAVTVCIDHRPAVVLASLRTLDDARLPDRTYAGPTLTPAIVTFIADLQARGHVVTGPMASPETVLEEMEAKAATPQEVWN